MMFARNVQFNIKTDKKDEFNRLFTSDVLPLLRQQPGFKNELMLLHDNRGVSISLWEDRTHAEKYQATTYPKVLEKLTPVMEGAPKIENFQVAASTLTV